MTIFQTKIKFLLIFFSVFALGLLLGTNWKNIQKTLKKHNEPHPNRCWTSLFKKIKEGHYYSQMGEDLILSILFNESEKKRGVFLDIGAYLPTTDSVSYYFYKHGWRGINIEPQKKIYEQLKQKRPQDINLNIAVSDRETTMTFNEIKDAPQESTFDQSLRLSLEQQNKKIISYPIKTTTLNHILSKYKVHDIDFINIDVEGWELNVIKGLDLKKYRPKVFCVELRKNNWNEFTEILKQENYMFVFLDRVNTYFVRKESPDLIAKFKTAEKVYKTMQRLVHHFDPQCPSGEDKK